MTTFVCFSAFLLLALMIISTASWILMVKKFNVSNEFVKYLVPGLGFFILVFIVVLSIRVRQDYYNEVWNFKVVKISHQERYSKVVSYTVQVPCGTDKKGHTKYRTETRYRTDYYGPYFNGYSESGNSFNISEENYISWKNRWENEKHLKTINGSATGFTTPIDGRYFESEFNQKFEDIFSRPEIHSYKNLVRGSNSIFEKTKGASRYFKNHPTEDGNSSAYFELGSFIKEPQWLNNVNAHFGNKLQIHIITIFLKEKESHSVVDQILTEWDGLNKNELVIFIASNGKNSSWVEVRSWMENTTLHGMLADSIMKEKELNGMKLASIYLDKIPQKWQRKSFKDFEYIRTSVSIPYYISMVIAFLISVSLIPIVCHYCYKDQKEKEEEIARKEFVKRKYGNYKY